MTNTIRTCSSTFGQYVTQMNNVIRQACLATLLMLFGFATSVQATTVALSAPASAANFAAGSNITVSATATPSGGQTITRVDFYQGTTLIATDTTSPYSIVWSAVPVGSYSLTAKATTNTAAVTTSDARTVTVVAAPTVSLIAPASNAAFVTGSAITLSATATAAGQTISMVEFYRGTTRINSVSTAPYSYTWTNVAAGSYSLTARVTTSLGLTATSTPIAIAVAAAPTISLSAPANAAAVGAGNNVTISATAAATGQTITRVDFYQGITLLGTATTAPYSFIWSNAPAGIYSLTAKATTNIGLTATSAARTLTVVAAPTVTLTAPANNTVTVPPANFTLAATTTNVAAQPVSKVDFYNGAILLGTATAAPYSVNWSNVPAGSYSLTAKVTGSLGSVGASTPATVTVADVPAISLTAPPDNSVSGAGSNITLTANPVAAGQTITRVDFYNGATLLGTATAAPYSHTWSNPPAGSYTLTAKTTTNLGLTATSTATTLTVVAAPTVTLTSPADNTLATAPASFTLGAAATAAAGQTIGKVDFYNGATLLGTATAAPYSYTWSNVAAGSHTLTARATDSLGSVTTSTAATVSVNAPPSVTLTAPANNSTATAPANLTVSADAADTGGSIAYVVFYANNIQIGILNTPPYSLDWRNVAAGSYQLIATATDNLGAVTLSSPISVTVNAPAQASQALYFIETDHLDTPRQLSDAAGNVVWRWENLDAFGNNPPDEDPDGDGQRHTFNLRFPGQYHDAETGTNYNYFRDYDPGTGRYVQSDPIGLAGGSFSTYAYVGGNPVSRVDRLGLDWVYSQSTGQMIYINNPTGVSSVVGTGYAGHNSGLNNPSSQGVPGGGVSSNAGPLPQGTYTIGQQQNNVTGTGVSLPSSMRLTPDPNNNMFDRNGFLIHGGNMTTQSSSQGCVVMSPGVRNAIGDSGDTVLRVVP